MKISSKTLKIAGLSVLGLAVIAGGTFAFVKIQRDHKKAVLAAVQKNQLIGKAVAIIPTTIKSAKASAPTVADTTKNIDSNIDGVPVLMYHYIGDLPANPDATREDLTVSTANFTAQVEWLKSQGYQSITMNQLYAWLKNKTPIPAKSVVFTFDDGYADTFDNAIPVLEANHMTGSFGIITGLVGGSVYATWDQIVSANAQGMEIVSHSYSHPDFAEKDDTDQTYEITKSDSDFSAHLGFVPDYFIYPYGDYNNETLSLLQSNGFLMSFTTAYGFVRPGENYLELPRVRVHGAETLPTFEYDLTGLK